MLASDIRKVAIKSALGKFISENICRIEINVVTLPRKTDKTIIIMEEVKLLTIDDLYITPFTARRVYSEDGAVSWIPVERNLHPTGVATIDFIARSMAEGRTDFGWIANRLGCTREDLWGWTRVTTGMSPREFRLAWMFRLADDLLRYTSMTFDEIAKRSGFRSASLLSQQYAKYRHCTPLERQRAIRKPRDEGKFRCSDRHSTTISGGRG